MRVLVEKHKAFSARYPSTMPPAAEAQFRNLRILEHPLIQQKLTPNTATDPAQQKMLQFMPVIFGAMMLWLPSGLTLYMLVNAIVSIIQQAILNKKFNIHPNAPVAAGAR